MKNILRLLFLLLFIISTAISAPTSTQERNALVSLYNSTNGDSWKNKTNWLAGDPCDNHWKGVSCTATGAIYKLDLPGNNLVGNIPTSIGRLIDIKYLYLQYNKLTGAIPSEIGNLSKLYYLKLYKNKISGDIPSSMGNLSKLKYMHLGYNQLTGDIPPSIGNLSNLYYMYLHYNKLSGSIPLEIGSLTKLVNMYLYKNQLTGEIPSTIGNLTKLKRFYASYNKLNGNIPATIGNLSSLQYMSLQYNQLSGTIPSEIGNLSNALHLYLYKNQLTGEIPSSIGNLTKLRRFYASYNKLTGSIPTTIGNMSSLQVLYLHHNQLSGSIPSEIGNLTNLIYLYLSTNQLTGEIPESIGNLKKLKRLYLSYNKLGGTIPESITNLINLQAGQLHLHKNYYKEQSSAINSFLYAKHYKEIVYFSTHQNERPCISLPELKSKITNNEDITQVNTSCLDDMSNLFKDNADFNQDISGWDTSKVTTMKGMFHGALAFNQPIGNWDTSKVTDMESMFSSGKYPNYMSFNQQIGNWNTSNVINMKNMFYCAASFNQPIGDWDTGKVTNMKLMFFSAKKFNQPIGEWDTGKVIDMASMFYVARVFNQPIENWDTSKVTNMSGMFYHAKAFNQPIGNWDTSSVVNMMTMFAQNKVFNQPIGKWDTSSVTNMINMFFASSRFNQNIKNWDISNVSRYSSFATNSNLEDKHNPFIVSPCITRPELDIMIANYEDVTQVNTGCITDMSQLFYNNTTFNQNISGWDVSSVINMGSMFFNASIFNQDIGNWDTSSVTNTSHMFRLAKTFNQPIGNWDVSHITNMYNMFYGAKVFNQPIGDWDVSSVINIGNMFWNATNFNQPIGDWDVSSVINMGYVFTRATSFNQPIGDWDVSNVTTMKAMFYQAMNFNQNIKNWNINNVTSYRYFSQSSALQNSYNPFFNNPPLANAGEDKSVVLGESISIEGSAVDSDGSIVSYEWKKGEEVLATTVSFIYTPTTEGIDTLTLSVTDDDGVTHSDSMIVTVLPLCITRSELDTMIVNDEDITHVNTGCLTDMSYLFKNNTDFNQDISKWDVSNVINMRGMFENARSFNQPIGRWNVSKVTRMDYMFWGTSFNQNISDWNVSSVIRMTYMFRNAKSFNQPIGDWDVSSVISMQDMFTRAEKFNQPLRNWDVSNVISMRGMFWKAYAFNQDLSEWDVSSVKNMTNMFAYIGMSTTYYSNLLVNWSKLTLQSNVVFNAGNSFYNLEASNFRQKIIDDFGWTIIDNGMYENTTPPVAKSFKVIVKNEAETDVQLIGTDIDAGTQLSYVVSNQPKHGDLTGIAPNLVYTPEKGYDGKDSFKYFVNDGEYNSTEAIVNINVVGINTFVTKWKTNNPGKTNDNQIMISTKGQGYNYKVDWGDGSTSEGHIANTTHTYDKAGVYMVAISGKFPRSYFNGWYIGSPKDDAKKLISIEQWGINKWSSMASAFSGCTNMVSNATDKPDISNVTDMSYMFNYAWKFNQDISDWNVSHVTNMRDMFMSALAFNRNIGNWDVSRVTDMAYMFARRGPIKPRFNQDISGWDVSSVIDMREMFSSADAFHQPIGKWDVSSVTNMQEMFRGHNTFNEDLSQWDVSSVTNMREMFGYAFAFNQDLSEWDVSSVTNMQEMFYRATIFNKDISNWDVSNVTHFDKMFSSAKAFNQDIGVWNMQSAISLVRMFWSATAFNQDIGAWNVSQVTNMYGVFLGASSFNQDLSNWDVSNVTKMTQMFNGAAAFDQNINTWNVSKVTDMSDMLNGVHLSVEHYDALLNDWNNLSLQQNVKFDAGLSQYSVENGKAPRQSIIDTFGWVITDSGLGDPRAPVAEDQSLVMAKNTANRKISIKATDANFDSLSFSIVEEPAHGELTGVAPDVYYTPNSNYYGEDSFTFMANDGELESNQATVSISVINVEQNVDSDNDHIPDEIEVLIGTPFNNDDEDDNGIVDGLESAGVHGDTFFDKQWHLRSLGTIIDPRFTNVPSIIGNDLGLLDVYSKYMGFNHGTPIIVQVVDNGVQANHEDLKNNMDLARSYMHIKGGSVSVGDPTSLRPGKVHGTMVAGIIAAEAFNGKGVRGIAPFAKIAGSNWLNYAYLEGLDYAWYSGPGANEIAISSNSWGFASGINRSTWYENTLNKGTAELRDGKGRIYVKSAGNSREVGSNANLFYVNNNRYIINVAALRHDNKYAEYSNPGGNLLISSYSGNRHHRSPTIGTTSLMGKSYKSSWGEDTNHNYTYDMSGTSAAAPGVSGVLALVLEACPSLTWREVKYLVAKHGKKVDASNASWVQNSTGLWHSSDYGYGLINGEGMINDCNTNDISLPVEKIVEANGTVDVAIADGTFTTIGGLNVSEDMIIEWVEITVDSNHTRASDYRVELISPAGTVSRLVDPTKPTGAWMKGGFRFGAAGFMGEQSQGEWRVKISDIDYTNNDLSGSIHSLKLKVYGH